MINLENFAKREYQRAALTCSDDIARKIAERLDNLISLHQQRRELIHKLDEHNNNQMRGAKRLRFVLKQVRDI